MKKLSAGLIPVFGNEFLILRCYNYWDFPKGGVEKGEEPLAAALRELREETTLERADLKWGEVFYETPPYAAGKVARYYIGRVDTKEVSLPINPLLGRAEHHEFRWVLYEDAHRLLNPRVQAALEWARRILSGA